MPVILAWFLNALLVRFVVQIFLSLGAAFVTYTLYHKALEYLKGVVEQSINALPETAYNLLMMAGVGKGLGFVFGALGFYASMKAVKKLRFAFFG
ncbi:DUF2523 family protein [Neisseria mucosa]|uniref:DUF2523 family protein n=1 Tax=Neisseria mucosa TaxID=488 RepID=UPI0018781DC9|nr:DUF2523 family protein [Neisseria mucosa]